MFSATPARRSVHSVSFLWPARLADAKIPVVPVARVEAKKMKLSLLAFSFVVIDVVEFDGEFP